MTMFRTEMVKKQDGITLIELVVTLAIITIAVGTILLIFVSGINIFDSGSSHYDIQGNARMASQFITEELRYAVEIEIMDESNLPEGIDLNDNTTIPNYQNYLYYNSISGEIRKINKFYTESWKIGNDGFLKVSSESEGEILKYNILAKDESKVYSIENEVNSLNLHLGLQKLIKTSVADGNQGIILKYVSISDYLSSMQLPNIEIGDTNNSTQLELKSENAYQSIISIEPNNLNSDVIYDDLTGLGTNTIELFFQIDEADHKDQLEITVIFQVYNIDLGEYDESTYIYTLIYSKQDFWTITDISG